MTQNAIHVIFSPFCSFLKTKSWKEKFPAGQSVSPMPSPSPSPTIYIVKSHVQFIQLSKFTTQPSRLLFCGMLAVTFTYLLMSTSLHKLLADLCLCKNQSISFSHKSCVPLGTK